MAVFCYYFHFLMCSTKNKPDLGRARKCKCYNKALLLIESKVSSFKLATIPLGLLIKGMDVI